MKRKITPFVENFAEATAACMIAMGQGNLLTFTLAHWLIATQTGVLAGAVASIVLLLTRADTRWMIAIVLGISTAVADLLVHPGMFGAAATEALVTGIGAALLSCLAGTFVRYWKARRPPWSTTNGMPGSP